MAKILVVDDEKSIRMTLSAFLRGAGYDVDIAADVEHAQELLGRGKFDVVVSDIVLPGISGVVLLRRIRKTAPDVQVIMMTGDPTVDTAAEAVRAGACDYLTKPVSKIAILLSVANAAKIKELEDENRRYRENLETLVAERTSELEQSVDSLKKAQERLIRQERMNALGQMASGIAHDFNNVLMPIVGFSELLLSNPNVLDDREKAVHMLEIIRSASQDAKHIVRRMRQVYKQDDREYGPVDLAQVVDSVVAITMPKWKEEMRAKGVTIDVSAKTEDVPLIHGDVSELREAFTNLIFNAVDALPDGGTITLQLSAQNPRSVLLEVSDTGIGMDEAISRRCAEPFFTTKGSQGTGLGLSLVQGAIQRHGGTMEIDSRRNVGTVIRMRFPARLAMDKIECTPEKEPPPLPPLRVLVIDDEARSLHLLASILSTDGHTVETADGGKTGLQMARGREFDLVITDRAMPLMSGDEVAAGIAKDRPGTPVIMLTGFGDIMEAKGECPAGVTRVISKPITGKDLRYVMTAVMREAGEKQSGEMTVEAGQDAE